MVCPHCLVSYHSNAQRRFLQEDRDGGWEVWMEKCPSCDRAIFILRNGPMGPLHLGPHITDAQRTLLVYPRGSGRQPVPNEVPDSIRDLYNEAAEVLPVSPRASAALSRRAVQELLRDHAGATQKDLFDQIQHVIDNGSLPSGLRGDIDAVRNIGNIGVHTQKSVVTGDIVDVEPDEATWNLDVLDGLFDFYFVGPAKAAAKRDALNAKLADAGRPPIR